MKSDLATGDVSRRHFIKLAGAGAAMLSVPSSTFAGFFEDSGTKFDFKQLSQTHDLPSLPNWGPYSKKYFGISHIPDVKAGLSFDFSIFPMVSGSSIKQVLPSVTDPSGVHPWEAAPNLGYYSMRFETIWKDQFYFDLSFSQLTEKSRLIRLECVNQTDVSQEITLNCLSQLVFPPLRELSAEPVRLYDVQLPPGAVWVHALDYADLKFAKPRPTDNLVTDGKWRAEERMQDSVDGSVIGQNFGADAGDTVVYRVPLKQSFANATLVWRFKMDHDGMTFFRMDGPIHGDFSFQGRGDQFSTASIALGKLDAGVHELRFTATHGRAPILNGFAIVEVADVDKLHFVERPWHPIPQIEALPNGLILKYDDVENYYGYALSQPLTGHDEIKWSALDAVFGTEPGPNTRQRIFGDSRRGRAGDPDSLFIRAFSPPLTIPPKATHIIYGLVCTGTHAEVSHALQKFNPQESHDEKIHAVAKRKAYRPVATPTGENYKLSQQLMSAVTLSNLVYPLYAQGNYIRHYSPGRSWDCLYTWDTGFIGLGLLELDLPNTLDILNAYLTAPGAQSAFIHHGSPVPVQIYLAWELWNRTQSRELLAYLYPRLRQYHAFLAGRLGSSTTRRHQDHLICTWDYFYNSGGWDDYPPQKYIHSQKMESRVAPVINSAHTIRCAKLLRNMAAALGQTDDFVDYDQDISVLSASLQKYSWDEASGYFGYVLHDDAGKPTGILRDSNNVNFNMGLDGIYPLVSGICSSAQEQQILERIFSPKNLWMDIGITTVDQSAPYYSTSGYWNGSVWLAHQWFFWKSMLDLGRGDLAVRIAQTGLNLWKNVTDSTYDCMEHFVPREPYGAGWNQFSSLSSPALSWFAALYTPGRFTCGFDTWIESSGFSKDNRRFHAKLKPSQNSGRTMSVLVCMNPGANYQVLWNGKPVQFTMPHDRLLQIQLPSEAGELNVVSV